jgi:hypothetical protein
VTLFSREGRRYLETGPFFKIHFVRPISQRFRRQNAPPCGPPGKQPKTETNLITPSVVSVTFISTSRSFPFPLKNRVHCIIRLLLLVSPMLNTSNSNISRKCAEFFFQEREAVLVMSSLFFLFLYNKTLKCSSGFLTTGSFCCRGSLAATYASPYRTCRSLQLTIP